MDVLRVEQDLLTRIDQSRKWILEEHSALEGFQFRTEHAWTANPIEFFDDANRVERYGSPISPV